MLPDFHKKHFVWISNGLYRRPLENQCWYSSPHCIVYRGLVLNGLQNLSYVFCSGSLLKFLPVDLWKPDENSRNSTEPGDMIYHSINVWNTCNKSNTFKVFLYLLRQWGSKYWTFNYWINLNTGLNCVRFLNGKKWERWKQGTLG